MNISFNDLENNKFIKIDELHHKQIPDFVRPYLKKLNFYTVSYNLLVIIPFLFFIIRIIIDYINHSFDSAIISFFAFGITGAFLLIPIHELIHALAYKLVGAKTISFGSDIKNFVFFAAADKFVADYKDFQIIALAPVVTITFISIIILFFISGNLVWSFIGLITVHSMFSGGDFGLLSYFHENRDKEIVTYDDVQNKISYFYSKENL